ncbi:hypothetical protein NQ318_021267, partial [Aromia moschata]
MRCATEDGTFFSDIAQQTTQAIGEVWPTDTPSPDIPTQRYLKPPRHPVTVKRSERKVSFIFDPPLLNEEGRCEGMRKVCAKLVPKVLTDDQKARR